MSVIVKLVGAGIGLASEAYKANKASKNGESSQNPGSQSIPNEDPPKYAEVTQAQADDLIAKGHAVSIDPGEAEQVKYNHRPEEGDEEIWALDDAGSAGPEAESSDGLKESKDVAATFLSRHPLPARQVPLSPLPCPVILPQRRPKNDQRGFVQAYAPVLANSDISQATWLEFLKAFQLSGRADPWLNAINTAAMIAGAVPDITVQAATAAVKLAVGVAMEVQRRTKTNTFLDRMNAEFFRPRGLFCLIMTYKPESDDAYGPVNTMSSLASTANQPRAWRQKLGTSSGTTHGELQLPEAAPLIFPALDELATDSKKQSKLEQGSNFVGDYLDRRAQAQYAHDNPGSSLVQTNPQFNSRYADPNHPVNNGDLVSLVSGGKLQGGGGVLGKSRDNSGKPKFGFGGFGRMGKGRGGGLQALLKSKRKDGDGSSTEESSVGHTQVQRGPGQLVKKALKKDVLYMMVANLPTEAEMEAARQAVANQERR